MQNVKVTVLISHLIHPKSPPNKCLLSFRIKVPQNYSYENLLSL